MEKPSVFISYNHESTAIVKRVIEKIDSIANVYWDDKLEPWGSFKEFMDSISKSDFVVVVISDAYLRSINCQYEVLQLMSNENWKLKSMFIVEDTDIYNAIKRAKYVDFWKSKEDEYQEELTKHDTAAVQDLTATMVKCGKIRTHISEFMNAVADANNPDIDTAIDAIADKMKISAKKNSHKELEEDIIRLISNGPKTIDEIGIATNRSIFTIRDYMSKLVKNGKIVFTGARGSRKYEIPS